MKIGIFGGTFNPPHSMHENVPKEIIEEGIVDKIIYVPTGDNYNFKKMVPFKHRYNMLNLIYEGNENVSVSDCENTDTMRYTYETLDYFQEQYPDDEICFIMGIDNLKGLDTWGRYEYMIKKYKFIIISRYNTDPEESLEKYKEYSDKIIYCKLKEANVSSTLIREDVHGMKDHLNPKVYEYIIENNLYQD